ncbi:hypothetical protein J8F10_34675 [Gemmata sp. G18]|uniref:ABC transporter permease n=1 Tax=Gemmata palustris TaxID=2822762 RepID=A0ABS5C353_9BACT|nr:hypothetical protein [Gemmata palustris]MBP3960400.1 hypothetical protein [Gemmata palustris]
MSSALFGILQLDRGDPYGYAQVAGLLQAWLQDAGGFAAVGLVVYLIYALTTPTDKSESERLRVPVSKWMLLMGAISLVCYVALGVLIFLNRGALPPAPVPQPGEAVRIDPPAWHRELQPMVLMVAGLFALLGLGEPFARDLFKILRRNVSFNTSGARRFGGTLSTYSAELLTRNRAIALAGALGLYAVVGVLLFAIGVPRLTGIWTWLLAVSAGVFLAALALLMLFEAEGPVWAIAKLSFKEAVRRQLLWVFLIILLPFLFPVQWFVQVKAADELRTTTMFLTVVLSVLVLVPAGLLAGFGIPDDIKNLNIFTVVSKPVERFEIVLGRFIGYSALMTLVLFALTGVSVVLITNTAISEKAREETYKARVPHRGKLEFKSMRAEDRQEKKDFDGTNVGREFDYRRYIAGHEKSPQRAIWKFAAVPGEMEHAQGDKVPVEFTFDVFRMTKGEQDKGVMVNFTFVTQNAPLRQPTKDEGAEWQWVDTARRDQYLARAEEFRRQGFQIDRAAPGDPAWAKVNELAEEFGFFEYKGKPVFDYAVMGIEVPAGLFRNANNPKAQPGKDERGQPLPRLSILVKCESEGQLLGMAEPDLYLLQNEMPYAVNFFKGMVGLWCRLCLVIGVAVAASTYLSGILAFLATGLIYITGFFTDHLNDLATGRNIGGPFQSMAQIVKAEQSTTPVSDTASARTLMLADKFAAWLFRRIQNVIPDIDSFSWGHFVSEGFNISTEYLVVNVLVTFGYLIPWAILAYYLMKSREVAA